MIFSDSYSGSNGVVKESQYTPDLKGALMLVYENEMNYNAMMRAVGISEMRYFQETGGDLFVQEAGALSGFIEKAKAFFKKVIEKIKSLFAKFVAVINQYTMKDSDFVKKYETKLMKVDIRGFEFKGYQFSDLDSGNLINQTAFNGYFSNAGKKEEYEDQPVNTDDDVSEAKDYLRAEMIGSNSKSMTEIEFRDTLKANLYGNNGDKVDLENIRLRDQLKFVKDTKANISAAEREQKKDTDTINKFIKVLEKYQKDFDKSITASAKDEDNQKNSASIKYISQCIAVAKSGSNDITTAFGMLIQALKDRRSQAKAICVKALSYKPKNEAAYREGAYNSIFDGVKIV